MFKGTAASPGIVLGKALVLEHNELVIEKKSISDVDKEIERLNDAVAISKAELEKVRDKAKVELGEEEAQIFESHLLVLEDPELLGSAIDKVKSENVNADFALNEIKEMFVGMFEAMDNEYMRERAADIKDVTNRILRHLLGVKIVDLAALEDEVVLVAHDLTPSDTATMDKKKVLGFLTDIGGRTSHTAIMARTLEVAAIVGLTDATEQIKDGDFVVFNGDTGEVILNPDEETIAKYSQMKKEFEEYTQNSHISDIIPIIQIDKQVDIKKINIQEVNELKLLEPYGEGNKMPVFLIKNLKILSIRSLSEGKHIKLKLGIDNHMIDAIGFNMGEVADKYLIGDKVDIVGSLEVNQFGGNENIQVNLKDLRKTI